MIRIVGNPVSPYVKKVLVALTLKGVEHELDPVVPFLGSEAFGRLSPLRRIPVLVDRELVVNDSSVICEYLEERFPDRPLLPDGAGPRARARWMEEWADTRLGDLCVWRLFFQRLVGPRVLKRPTDEALVARTTERDLPEALDWLETQAPARDYLFGARVGTADVTVAAMLHAAELAGWRVDAERWPRVAGWCARVAAVPAYAECVRLEGVMLSTRPAEQRAALAAAGVRVAAETVAGTELRGRVE